MLQTNFKNTKEARKHYGVWSDGCPTVNTSTEYFNETGGPDGMGAWQTFHYHSPSVRSSIYVSKFKTYFPKTTVGLKLTLRPRGK